MPELLISCQDLGHAYGAEPLFEGLSLGLFEGDHVGLVGPNGAGKSTLLRILAGLEQPTWGSRAAKKRLRLGLVPQDPVFDTRATVGDVLRAALPEHSSDAEGRLAVTLGQAGFVDAAQPTSTLSGGWRKRLAIARELLGEPELLLLDEPTNHLDVDGILWLEELLRRVPQAFLAVSHDRYFLEAVAGRVLELNRAFAEGCFDVRGNYSRFLEKKDELLAGQAASQEALRNRVRGELVWLSHQAKARTRKAQARIDEASRLQAELADLDSRSSTPGVALDFSASERRTKRLVEVRGLHKSYGERALVQGLDLLLSPGLRLGLLGANGSGKSTLLRLLAGLEAPDAGLVEHAPQLRIVIFDQHRSRLDPALSLRRALAPAGDSVQYQGRAVHVAGWAKRFLFRSEQLDQPVSRLSGGEQARVLIALLMLEPADVLFLDEPTNDLDIPTLEVLEESLLEFPGALVLVTHDRFLLERVSTRLLALDGRGGALFFADYAQWESARREALEQEARRVSAARAPRAAASAAAGKPRRLGYVEQREWEGMEARVLAAEAQVEVCRAAAEDPAIASDHQALRTRHEALFAAQVEADRLYARWAELEEKLKS